MILIIDRATWLQGEPASSWLLRGHDGKQCCLGFLALVCGALPSDIINKGSPARVPHVNWPKALAPIDSLHVELRGDIWNNTNLTSRLMGENDEPSNDRSVGKEVAISRLMLQADVNVVFTGKYPETT